jgi:hypothetical protein
MSSEQLASMGDILVDLKSSHRMLTIAGNRQPGKIVELP